MSKYNMTDTYPQDMQHRSLRDPMKFKLHELSPMGQEFVQMGEEFLRSILAVQGGLGIGRLTGVGRVSTGFGGANVAFTGRSLIPSGWRQASCEIDVAGANNGLIWECIAPGAEGNGIIVEYVDNAAGTVVWNATTRTVTCNIDVTGAGITVANLLIALAASATGAQYVVQARNSYGSSGAGTIDAIASATMAGGTGTCMGRYVLTRAEGANKDLEFEAIDFGPDAKTITMSYVHSAGMTTLPTVAVTEGASTVAIVVTATIATHTALNILQALRNSDAAMEWIHARLADGSNGSGTPAAFAATALTAPFGTDGFTARIGGLIANVQSLTDDGGTFDCATGVGTAGDTVEFVIRVGGIEHRCSAAVVA